MKLGENPRKKPDGGSLASRLRVAREEAGLSQSQLAKEVGCARQYLVGIEKGRNTGVGAELALRLSERLNVSVRWLLWGDTTPLFHKLDKDEQELVYEYRLLPHPIKGFAIDSIKSLAARFKPSVNDPYPAAALLYRPPKK